VAIGLDDDAVARSAEVEDLERATLAPSSAGGAGLELLPPQRGVALEGPLHVGGFEVGDGRQQVAVPHIDPAANRSIASSTSS